MTFKRTYDEALIREVMTHPALWDAGADDYAGRREDFTPRMDPAIHYVRVDDGDGTEFLGLFVLAPQSTVCWEIHTRLLPLAWGERATRAMRGVCALAFAGGAPGCRRIVGAVPATNRLAIRFAERCGFVQYGVNEKSYLKNGALLDQVLLGFSPKE